MLTTVYLLRHGMTAAGESGRYNGRTDVPLSEKGIDQMAGAAKLLKRFSSAIDLLYCSDLDRAVKSAEVVGTAYDLSPTVSPLLRERDFGRWEGLTFDEIRNRYPGEFEQWTRDPSGFRPAGGESGEDVRQRVVPFFHDLTARHLGGKIAVVAHGGVNRIILCTLLEIPLERLFRIGQDYGALNVIEYRDEEPLARAVNLTCRPG